jgi:hypothetical protein
MTTIDRIRALYFGATEESISRDFDEAIDLLKTLGSEEEREQAAVFMEGLSEMRSEWGVRPTRGRPAPARPSRKRIPRP